MDKRNFLKLLGVGAAGAIVDPTSLAGPLPDPHPVILLPVDQIKALPPRSVPLIFVDNRPLPRLRRWNMHKEVRLDPIFRSGFDDLSLHIARPSHWELEVEVRGSEDVFRICVGDRHQLGVCLGEQGGHITLLGEAWLKDREVACRMATSYCSTALELPWSEPEEELLVRLTWRLPHVEMVSESDFFNAVGYDPKQIFVALRP